MLTGVEIQNYAETRLGRELDADLMLMAINEAAQEIGDLGLLYDTIEVEVDDTEQRYNMPDNYTFVEQVLYHRSGEKYLYHHYNWRTGSISFSDKGEYTIIARKMPESIEVLSEPLTQIHPLYHNAIKFYALAWFKENDDYSSQEAERLYQKFQERVRMAMNRLLRSKSPTSWQVVRRG